MSEHTQETIDFNLDTVEREKQYSPFKVNVAGRVIYMRDPAELDWKDLLKIENPAHFLRYAVSEDDREFLREQKIEGWRFGKLIEAYQKHYGLGDQGNGGGSPI